MDAGTRPPTLLDRHGRPLRNLRLSVTDRCNLRCAYCMPEASYVWLPRQDLLTYEEVSRLVDVFVALGVDRRLGLGLGHRLAEEVDPHRPFAGHAHCPE